MVVTFQVPWVMELSGQGFASPNYNWPLMSQRLLLILRLLLNCGENVDEPAVAGILLDHLRIALTESGWPEHLSHRLWDLPVYSTDHVATATGA